VGPDVEVTRSRLCYDPLTQGRDRPGTLKAPLYEAIVVGVSEVGPRVDPGVDVEWFYASANVVRDDPDARAWTCR